MSLRTELGGSIGSFLVIYTIRIYKGAHANLLKNITIWIDNTKLISPATVATVVDIFIDYLVLDYDIWMVITSL